MRQLRLPVGIEDFAEIRRNEYYYVDKTQLIEQVLDRRNKVTLFTRPRRFGKTLNMSMLQYFSRLEWIQHFLTDFILRKIRSVRCLYGQVSSSFDQLKGSGCGFV